MLKPKHTRCPYSHLDTETIHDMEIDSLMSQDPKSVDEIAEEGMDGRERRKHFVEKAMRLAGVGEEKHAWI